MAAYCLLRFYDFVHDFIRVTRNTGSLELADKSR